MPGAYIFLAEGFEETEAVTTADILRRAGVDAKLVSITGSLPVKSRDGVTVTADLLFENIGKADALIVPGGPVLDGYRGHPSLAVIIKRHYESGGLVAAICAAPVFLAELGLLKGKTAVCYPTMENELVKGGAVIGGGPVAEDGNIITSRGPGTTPLFALAAAARLAGKEAADKVRQAFLAG